MDDETAEIELLEQNLNKTRQISQRMVSILTSFESRVNGLEKSVRPLYETTQVLTRRAKNIESALQKIDEVASNQEGIAAEEALVLRGPQPGQFDIYKEALERLNASIAFTSSDKDARDTARLVESGAKKLAQLYTKLVAEGSSGVPNYAPNTAPPPFPDELLSELLPLVAFLRALPIPASHPSHPAANEIQSALKDAQRGYADMRGNWSRKCLETQGRRVVERAETIDSVAAGQEFGRWVEMLLKMAEDEYQLLLELAPLPTQSLIASTYSTLLTPVMNVFSSTFSSLSSLIKRSLNKHTFLALSAFEAMQAHQQRARELLQRRTGRNTDELKDAVQAVKAMCLRSFPEFLADVKLAGMGQPGKAGSDTSTSIADFAVSTVKFLARFPEVQGAVCASLVALGDGKWRMGEGVQVASSRQEQGAADEQVVLEHYLHDVITTTINSLNSVSRTQRRAPFGSFFLLNNISYLRRRLLEDQQSGIDHLLARPTADGIESNMRLARSVYLETNFMPLMQSLGDDPKDKGKASVKEKAARFFDLFDEVAERHRMAKVLEEDQDSRETMAEEVVKIVVPSLQRFTQKHRDIFSKNPQKYLKLTPEAVESQIRGFY